MEKISVFLDLFRKGTMVADPKVWKDRAALTMAIAGVIMAAVAVARMYGYELPIDDESAVAIAGGIAVLVGVFSTYATSTKVGLLPPKRDSGDGVQDGPRAETATKVDLPRQSDGP